MTSSPFNSEQLAAFVMGDLDAATSARVEAWVAGSARGQQLTSTMRLALATMRTDDSVVPPAALVDRVKTILRPVERPTPGQWLENLGRSIAGLVFDSRAQVALAGFRGASATDAQLAFSCGAGEIDLQMTPPETARERAWQLRGQLSTRDGEAIGQAAIALIDRRTREVHASAETAASGEFQMQALPGEYDLALKIGEEFVTVPEILVG